VIIFDSKILDSDLSQKLTDLCEFSSGLKMQLLYRASEHGLTIRDFHSRCDKHSNTLTVVKTTDGYIFGGYTQQTWDSTFSDLKSDKNAFIFSLINRENNPLKMRIKSGGINATFCNHNFGPRFGGADIIIGSSGFLLAGSSNLGNSYQHPTYAYQSSQAQSFLAGFNAFKVSEIEIFKLIQNLLLES
jgi:hypothetical protein